MANTTHISWKRNENVLREREKSLGRILNKNTSDLYKYCLNRVYIEVMVEAEDGKQISFY